MSALRDTCDATRCRWPIRIPNLVGPAVNDNHSLRSEACRSIESVTDRIDLLGVAIDNVSMAEAIDRIVELAHTRRGAYVVTPNVDHLVKLQHHKAFREVYEHADLVLADGMPLIWASRLLGSPLKEKVSGSDLFVKFAGRAAR